MKFPKPDVEQFFQTISIKDFVISPEEEQLLISTNINGHYNLWGMDLPNKYPYPLTFRNQQTYGIRYDKKGDFILVGFDHDGDENIQLYALPPRGGNLIPVREAEGEKHYMAHLTEDGKRLYYTASTENPTYLNGYCLDLDSGEESLVIKGEDAVIDIVGVSDDEKSIVYTKHFSNTYSPAYIRRNGKDIPLAPQSNEEFMIIDVVYTANDAVYFTTNFEADFSYLARFDIQAEKFHKVVTLENEDLTKVHYDEVHRQLYLLSTSGVEDRLFVHDLSSGKTSQKSIPVNLVNKLSISKNGNIYILGYGSTEPSNIYRLKHGKEQWELLTNNQVPGVPKEMLVEPEVVRYPSFDGLEIEALFYQAKEENANGYVIHWPHGGPQSAERKMFWSLYQFLLHRGYSIFAPNFRGSSGYGLRFMKMVEQDWGFGPRLDNVKGIEWLVKQGYVDHDKVLLMGGSYGGYMALLLHGRHAELYKAVVDICGPSNLFSFIDSVPEHWKPSMTKFVGDPIEHKEKLKEDSPITYLDYMNKPMLMIQGANDPRVVKTESDQIVEALKQNGTEVEYMVLEDEGHGFAKKENEIKVYRKILEFFDHQTS